VRAYLLEIFLGVFMIVAENVEESVHKKNSELVFKRVGALGRLPLGSPEKKQSS